VANNNPMSASPFLLNMERIKVSKLYQNIEGEERAGKRADDATELQLFPSKHEIEVIDEKDVEHEAEKRTEIESATSWCSKQSSTS
jgi:hypothetical protein